MSIGRLKILYEDNHLIAVFKPAGVLVQGDKSGAPNLLDRTRAYLKEKYKKPGNVFLGLVHRLDRPVSGIVLFAKTSKGAARVSEQFREHTIRKFYHAVVAGRMAPPHGTLVHRLAKNESTRKTVVVDEDGDVAELVYETVSFNEKYSLLKIELITGRFHQIRAQLAEAGHPIVGDLKYGSKEKLPDGDIALAATELTFTTATTDEVRTISVPYPPAWRNWLNS